MTGERYPDGRFGTPELPEASDEDSRAASLARAAQRLPKPAPSQAVGLSLNVTPLQYKRHPGDDDERWQAEGDAEQDLREIRGRADKPETIVQAVDEQRAYGEHNHPEKFTVVGLLRFRNEQLSDSNARLTERLADATVRAYEPPDTLPSVAFAAVEGLVATGKRWWRG